MPGVLVEGVAVADLRWHGQRQAVLGGDDQRCGFGSSGEDVAGWQQSHRVAQGVRGVGRAGDAVGDALAGFVLLRGVAGAVVAGGAGEIGEDGAGELLASQGDLPGVGHHQGEAANPVRQGGQLRGECLGGFPRVGEGLGDLAQCQFGVLQAAGAQRVGQGGRGRVPGGEGLLDVVQQGGGVLPVDLPLARRDGEDRRGAGELLLEHGQSAGHAGGRGVRVGVEAGLGVGVARGVRVGAGGGQDGAEVAGVAQRAEAAGIVELQQAFVPLLVRLLGGWVLCVPVPRLFPCSLEGLGGLLGEHGVIRDERGDGRLGVQGRQDRLALEGVFEAAGEVAPL